MDKCHQPELFDKVKPERLWDLSQNDLARNYYILNDSESSIFLYSWYIKTQNKYMVNNSRDIFCNLWKFKSNTTYIYNKLSEVAHNKLSYMVFFYITSNISSLLWLYLTEKVLNRLNTTTASLTV